MSPVLEEIEKCRSCGGGRLSPLLELGRVPLANALLTEGDLLRDEPRYPLTLMFCGDCSLVQIRETIDPQVLFRHYLYFSSFSDTMLAHAREESETIRRRCRLGPGNLVVEIASNDGYLLKNFSGSGIDVLGIDPARNVAEVAEKKGIPTLCEFFDDNLARRLQREGRTADVIVANNVLPHVADLNGLVGGMAILLKKSGCAVIEFPYLGELIAHTEFDTIYHEHLHYFTLRTARSLFERHGLHVSHVERVPIHGGSLRLYLHPEEEVPGPSREVDEMIQEELQEGMGELGYYQRFSAQVAELQSSLRRELRNRKAAGQTLAGYGASAKGSTLLNTTQIGGDLLDFIVDRSSVKQGRFTPGNRLPILPPSALLERRPRAVLLLTWNFAEEIFCQQETYLREGGEFVIPIPRVRSVGSEVLG